jgi:hypothetical protein
MSTTSTTIDLTIIANAFLRVQEMRETLESVNARSVHPSFLAIPPPTCSVNTIVKIRDFITVKYAGRTVDGSVESLAGLSPMDLKIVLLKLSTQLPTCATCPAPHNAISSAIMYVDMLIATPVAAPTPVRGRADSISIETTMAVFDRAVEHFRSSASDNPQSNRTGCATMSAAWAVRVRDSLSTCSLDELRQHTWALRAVFFSPAPGSSMRNTVLAGVIDKLIEHLDQQ